jgi:hypothetical protein
VADFFLLAFLLAFLPAVDRFRAGLAAASTRGLGMLWTSNAVS